MGEVIAFQTRADIQTAVFSSSEGLATVIPFPVQEWEGQAQAGSVALGMVVGAEAVYAPALRPERPALYLVPDDASEAEEWDTEQETDSPLATVHYIGSTVAESTVLPEREPISDDDRVLTEVDHLTEHRLPDGSYPAQVEEHLDLNLTTAVKESSIPHAVSKVFQEYVPTGEYDERGRPIIDYMWLGRTAVKVAASGYKFHRAPEALLRVDVEVDEAAHNSSTMRRGYAKVFISPRDARLKDEHLGDDDAIRISYLGENDEGKSGRIIESILVEDVPLEAWEKMFADPNNLWGRSIPIEEPGTPLGIMKAHRELEIPLDKLPEGVVTLVAEAVRYIDDPAMRESVEQRLALFRGDQEEIDRHAKSIAMRWKRFEIALDQSFASGFANEDIMAFVEQLKNEWSDEDNALFARHRTTDGRLEMTRALAARLERARRNVLWTAAGVVAGNKKVLKQISVATAEQIYTNEMQIQMLVASPQVDPAQIARLESANNQTIAQNNVKVGGGCPGDEDGGFRKIIKDTMEAERKAGAESENDTYHGPQDKFGSLYFQCPHCKKTNKRPRAKTPDDFLENCQHCRKSVRC